MTKTAWTTVKNKIPDVSNLVKKTDYYSKVIEIENKLSNRIEQNKKTSLLKMN